MVGTRQLVLWPMTPLALLFTIEDTCTWTFLESSAANIGRIKFSTPTTKKKPLGFVGIPKRFFEGVTRAIMIMNGRAVYGVDRKRYFEGQTGLQV
jgi:hypothetical protein